MKKANYRVDVKLFSNGCSVVIVKNKQHLANRIFISGEDSKKWIDDVIENDKKEVKNDD